MVLSWILVLALFFAGQASDLKVTPCGRWLDKPTTVTFKSDIVNPTFRYLLKFQGLTQRPTNTIGTVWNGSPIAISSNSILSVIAYNSTYYDPVSFQTHTYFFLDAIGDLPEFGFKDPNLRKAWLALPTISITYATTIPVQSNNAPTVPGQFEWIRPDDPEGRTFYVCGTKYSGNYNVYLEKKSYRMYFSTKDYGGPGKFKEDIYANYSGTTWPYRIAVDKFENVQFRSGSADSIVYMEWAGRNPNVGPTGSHATMIRNHFGDELQLQLGHHSAHGRYVHLFDNGLYFGVYHVRERLDANYLSEYLGLTNKDHEFVNHCVIRDGDGTLWNKLTATQGNYKAFSQTADVQNLCDYMLIQQYNLNIDVNSCWNWQGYGPYAGSQDGTTGSFQYWGSDIDMGWFHSGGGVWTTGPGGAWGSLWAEKHPDFVSLFHDRLYFLFFDGGVMTPANLISTWKYCANLIRPGVPGEVARWRAYTVNNRFTVDRWEQGIQEIIDLWLAGPRETAYFNWLRGAGQFMNGEPPQINPDRSKSLKPGSTITITPRWSGTTMYYTLDGSDPRESGGTISSKAQSSTTTVTLTPTSSVTVKARSRSSTGAWSPINVKNFYMAGGVDGFIQVTELSTMIYEDSVYVEMIELKNIGSQVVNLAGCYFDSERTRFTFEETTLVQPGKFLVGTNMPLQFYTIYKKKADFYYTGDFKKNSKFKLKDAFDTTMVSVEWENDEPWPALVNYGFNYVPGYEFDEKSGTKADSGKDWRFSTNLKGSPWADDPKPVTLTSFDQGNNYLVVNEIMWKPTSGKRWIEFKNKGTSAINIGRWGFTDNWENPTKYTAAPGTSVPAGGFLVLDEDQLGFSLKGEEYFYYFNNGTDYAISLPGTRLQGVSQGRITTSDGKEYFTHMKTTTKSGTNSAPYIPNVVISGFSMATVQYIKLTSVDTKNVDLTGWVVELDGEKYTFKKSGIHMVILEPGQSVYLISEKLSISQFKSAYGTDWLDPKSIVLPIIPKKNGNFYNDFKLRKPDDGDQVTVDRFDFKTLEKSKKREIEQALVEFQRKLSPVGFSYDPASWTTRNLDNPTPVDCVWGNWGTWETCFCGVGQQSRTRKVQTPAGFGGKECNEFDATQTQVCGATTACDCSWSSWGAWTVCSVTCGLGQQTRTRSKIPAANGGKDCNSSDASVTGPCILSECPIDCSWNDWTIWSVCSAVTTPSGCGTGTQLRTRQSIPAMFGGKPCLSSPTEESASCTVECPPVQPSTNGNQTGEEESPSLLGDIPVVVIFAVLLGLFVVALIVVALIAAYTSYTAYAYKKEGGGGYVAY